MAPGRYLSSVRWVWWNPVPGGLGWGRAAAELMFPTHPGQRQVRDGETANFHRGWSLGTGVGGVRSLEMPKLVEIL